MFDYFSWLWLWLQLFNYSVTCLDRPPLLHRGTGLSRQVAWHQRLDLIWIITNRSLKNSLTKQVACQQNRWPVIGGGLFGRFDCIFFKVGLSTPFFRNIPGTIHLCNWPRLGYAGVCRSFQMALHSTPTEAYQTNAPCNNDGGCWTGMSMACVWWLHFCKIMIVFSNMANVFMW